MGLVLLIVLLVLMFGSAPAYPYSRGWGYQPMGIFGFLLVVLLFLVLFNMLPLGFGYTVPWHRPVVVAP